LGAANTRSSSEGTRGFRCLLLENAISSGILSMGWTCCHRAAAAAGVAYVTRSLRADAASSHRVALPYDEMAQIFRARYKLDTRLSQQTRAGVQRRD